MALYNKYRPLSLAEVQGQAHVKTILSSQVEKDDLVHAYLFTGPAGTGKTSVARILASMVNCKSGMTVNPPPDDDYVSSIIKGNALDVVEIDAATTNGIDDIRSLREKLKYSPTLMRKKVLILDECHRLSSAAWEGLLKILEEPPEYALFVLCTTEPSKVTETVKSRCMILTFNSLMAQDISLLVKKIAKSEGIEFTDDGLSVLAGASRGSFRLAISSLEQLKHLESPIGAETVSKAIGTTGRKILRDFVRTIISGDFMESLVISSGPISYGTDAFSFLSDLASLFHDLLVLIAKNYDLRLIGYTEDDENDLRILQSEILEKLSVKKEYSHLLRVWIRETDKAASLSVFKLEPQFHVDYTYAELRNVFKKASN